MYKNFNDKNKLNNAIKKSNNKKTDNKLVRIIMSNELKFNIVKAIASHYISRDVTGCF